MLVSLFNLSVQAVPYGHPASPRSKIDVVLGFDLVSGAPDGPEDFADHLPGTLRFCVDARFLGSGCVVLITISEEPILGFGGRLFNPRLIGWLTFSLLKKNPKPVPGSGKNEPEEQRRLQPAGRGGSRAPDLSHRSPSVCSERVGRASLTGDQRKRGTGSFLWSV